MWTVYRRADRLLWVRSRNADLYNKKVFFPAMTILLTSAKWSSVFISLFSYRIKMGVPHFRDSRTKQSYFIFILFSTSASNGIDGIPPKFSTHSDAAAFANPAYSTAISNVIFSIDSFD